MGPDGEPVTGPWLEAVEGERGDSAWSGAGFAGVVAGGAVNGVDDVLVDGDVVVRRGGPGESQRRRVDHGDFDIVDRDRIGHSTDIRRKVKACEQVPGAGVR